MKLADDAATADEGGRRSAKEGSSKGKAKAKDKGKGNQSQGGAASRSSSRPMRSASSNKNALSHPRSSSPPSTVWCWV